MSILDLHKKFLAALLLAVTALVLLPGCSTTEEESSGCPQDDLDCKEQQVQDLPV